MFGLINRIRREIEHFRSMQETARILTLSYFLRSIAYPLLSIFTGAFIWKTSNDPALLVLYYMGNFIMLPIMFLLNRRLLSYISLRKLYTFGMVFSGIGPLLVVFQKQETAAAFLLYGIVYGIGNGIYWANRNFLTVKHTQSAFRSYFTGLQFTLGTLASMVVPVIAGWIVVSSIYGYQIIIVAAFLLLVASGFATRSGIFEQPDITRATDKPLSPAWNKARLLSVAIGCVDSLIYIFPTVLILMLSDSEAVLGVVSSTVAMVSAGISYVFGRKYKQAMYHIIFPAMLAVFAIAGFPLLLGVTVLTVSWYLVLSSLADSVMWIASEPVLMDMMDSEVHRSKITLYRLIIEREWCVNTGRVAMLLLFLGITVWLPTFAVGLAAISCGVVALGFTGWTLYRRRRQNQLQPAPWSEVSSRN